MTTESGVPAAATPKDALAGRLQEALGTGYRVERELGAGGFAIVYLVKDLDLKRNLAVKVLSPDLITSKTVLERFRREAETIAQLSHPHIVPLHFIGQKDDLLYLAMECVDGYSLADRIEREGRLPVDDAVRFLREVASALDYAHRRGVIHRDIKPHNILIQAETGRALVTDFGIARTAEGASLTASGMLVGTPAYLSPEQVSGAPSDHRADIYALGVMGYEMLAGKPPFEGPTPTAVLMKRLAGPPPAVTVSRPDIPAPVADTVMRCLASEPADRYATAGEVAIALGGATTPVSAGHPTAEMVARMRRSRRQWTTGVIAAAVVLAAAGAAVLAFGRRGAPAAPVVPQGMVLIPADSFTIGDDLGPAYSRPKHRVRLDSFAIDATEVTVGQYGAFLAQRHLPLPWTTEPDPRLPVTGVNFIDAVAYCANRAPGGRLPSEEEWEAAARGPQGYVYPWGNTWDPGAANTASSKQNHPVPVGAFTRAATLGTGIVDMVGNVWEWTQSAMTAYPGGTTLRDGQNYRVIRGGAFDSPPENATTFARGYLPPTSDNPARDYGKTGFRCVVPMQTPAR